MIEILYDTFFISGIIDDRRSISCACIFLGPNLVSWSSKKQPLVDRFSIEAEYRSLADITTKVMWLQSILEELKVPSPRPVIYCDNLSTVMLSHNPVLHSRMKHMKLNLFFVREKVMQRKLLIAHIPSFDQPAELLTKAVSNSKFSALKGEVKVKDLQQVSKSQIQLELRGCGSVG